MQACGTVDRRKQPGTLPPVGVPVDIQSGDRMPLPVKFSAELQACVLGAVLFADVSDDGECLKSFRFVRPGRRIARIEQDVRTELYGLSEEIGLCNPLCRAVHNRREARKIGSVRQSKGFVGRVIPRGIRASVPCRRHRCGILSGDRQDCRNQQGAKQDKTNQAFSFHNDDTPHSLKL